METLLEALNVQVYRINGDLVELFFNPRDADLRVGETLTIRERESGRNVIAQVIAFRSATYPSLVKDQLHTLIAGEEDGEDLLEALELRLALSAEVSVNGNGNGIGDDEMARGVEPDAERAATRRDPVLGPRAIRLQPDDATLVGGRVDPPVGIQRDSLGTVVVADRKHLEALQALVSGEGTDVAGGWRCLPCDRVDRHRPDEQVDRNESQDHGERHHELARHVSPLRFKPAPTGFPPRATDPPSF